MKRTLLTLVLVLLVGCGVPEDDAPQELSAEDVPFGLLTTPSTTTPDVVDPPPSRSAELYFITSEGKVEAVPREVTNPRSPEAVLTALLGTAAEDIPTGLTSNIPPDTVLFAEPILEDGVLTVDLSEEFELLPQAEGGIAAVAQIVFTAASLSNIDAVQFRVEGEDFPVSDQEGAQQTDAVSRNDYDSLLAV